MLQSSELLRPEVAIIKLQSWIRVSLVAAGLTIAGAALWTAAGANPISARVLGVPELPTARVASAVSVSLTGDQGNFRPRATVLVIDSSITFANRSNHLIEVRSAALSPSPFDIRLPARGSATIRLHRPGLYHYYDAATAHPTRAVAGNEIVVATDRSNRMPREGWIAIVPGPPGMEARLTIPRAQDLFAPKVLVTVVGASVIVSNHDSDAHNFLIDPASPAGGAFLIDGTAQEPPSGWQRVLTMQQSGLYHVYCSMHTRVTGTVDGWRVVQPRSTASGFHDRNPMEAWIIALPPSAV